ncbi:MAG: ABC transporter ATP-binding protein [Candidatus Heimdallarchaeota archaeon]
MVSVQTRDIWFRYSGHSEFILKSVSWGVSNSQSIGVLGTNGSGKSTFLRLLAGIITSERGSVLINGKKVVGVETTRGLVSFVPENAKLFLVGPTGFRDLLRIDPDPDKVNRLINKYKLTDIINSKLYALSEGQRRLLALFAAFQLPCQILLFDEPTIGLDTSGRQLFTQLVGDATQAGKIVFIATNDSRLFSHVDKIIVLEGGGIKLNGMTRDILYRLEGESNLVPSQLVRTVKRLQSLYPNFPSVLHIEELNSVLSR